MRVSNIGRIAKVVLRQRPMAEVTLVMNGGREKHAGSSAVAWFTSGRGTLAEGYFAAARASKGNFHDMAMGPFFSPTGTHQFVSFDISFISRLPGGWWVCPFAQRINLRMQHLPGGVWSGPTWRSSPRSLASQL